MKYTRVTDTPFFMDIPSLDSEWVCAMFFEHRLRKKQVLFYQGDPASTLCIVKTGSLVKAFVSETRSLVLAHHGSGDVIGEAEVLYSHR